MLKSQVTNHFKGDAAGGSHSVSSNFSHNPGSQYPDSLGADLLLVAVIGPDDLRRRSMCNALSEGHGCEIKEFSDYPASLDEVPKILEQRFDVLIIDLDSIPEYALELVESFCANGAGTVMVYSAQANPEMLVRCMRAGAREFLTLPFAAGVVAESLVRASARRSAVKPTKKTAGKLLVFLGAKGGAGTTTLACNFAVSLAQESGQSTLLIDLDLPLGDAALNLGIVAEYSTVNALQNSNRLDSAFLATLLIKHSSGVSVLAAPGKFPQYQATNDQIDKLLAVARQDFDYVVVDVGSRFDLTGTALFKDATAIYLITQVGIPELRNSNRLISSFFTSGGPKLEIVINRWAPKTLGVAEEHITKALTRPAQWKMPDDYATVRRMQNTATPLALEDSPISRMIRTMAKAVTGQTAEPEKKKGFSFFKG